MKSAIPSWLRLGHEELNKKLKEFIKLGDKTGEAAKRVEKLLHAHFARQEKYMLPPLGLLQSLAEGKLPEKMRAIVEDSDEVKEELPKRISEHQQIIPALRKLEEIAEKEKHPTVKPFVEVLILYGVMEEEVMFPAAVLVGEFLKLNSESRNRSKNKRMETNETLATIYERRAVRKYKEKPVDKALIDQIIDAGRMAPSAMNRQLWKFYVLTDRNLITSLSPFIVKVANKVLNWAQGADHSKTTDIIFHHAPAVIFITAPKKNKWAALDVGMCCQNMMLAAKSLGLDSCPIGLAKFLEKTEKISILGMLHSEQIQLALTVGYGDERPAVHERKKDNVKFVTTSAALV